MATAANSVHKLQKTQYVGANNTMVHTSDVIVKGNLTVVGQQTYAQTQTLIVKDNIITLNAAIDQSGVPISDAGIEIDRGSEQNVWILWNETVGAWQFTNDGVNIEAFGGGSAGQYANLAYAHANAAFASANNVAPQVQPAFDKANAAFNFANTSTAWGTRQAFVATAGQTTFTPGSGYLPGYIDVYYNGIKLYGAEDYTATDGINITLSSPATVNSVIEVVGFGANVPVGNVYVLNSMASLLNRQTFFANNGQTVFTPTQKYRVGYVDVYYNGLKMSVPDDVVANDGTSIYFVGLTPTTNDVIELVGLTPNVALANAIPITGGNVSGGLTLTGNVLPSTDNTYYLGSSTNRWHSLFVGPGSVDIGGLKLSNVGGVLSVSSPGAPATPIAGEDSWARVQANLAYSSANNVAPQIQPAFSTANAAFLKANTAAFYDANTSNTGYLSIPKGTTAQRPASPDTGAIRYNTTTGSIESYLANNWVVIAAGNYTISYLIAAGGGGGGRYGGGGAGGVLTGNTVVQPGTAYSIVVGAGGNGTNSGSGANGSNSSIASFGLLALGGGGGADAGSSLTAAKSGGSGGGGSYENQPNGQWQGGAGTPGQGYPGGKGMNNGTDYGGGGGGGAGGAAVDATSPSVSGVGGVGILSTINGSSTYYGGGGGGSQYRNSGTAGPGGLGGGGTGAKYGEGVPVSIAGSAGTAGTGGGGGGAYPGGSGVVIIAYQSAVQRGSGGTVTSYSSSGIVTWVHTYTGTGTFTFSA